jgi:hypothetical protein
MGSFLELWGNAEHPKDEALPTMETAFAAYAYNRIVGSGMAGGYPSWIFYAVHQYGMVPKGAARYNPPEIHRLSGQWVTEHAGLIDEKPLEELLTSRFVHHSSQRPFSPKDYLARQIHIDMRDFSFHANNYPEKFIPSENNEAKYPYRVADAAARKTALNKAMTAAGIATEYQNESPARLYSLVKEQIYDHHPVYAAIRTGVVRGYLGNYHVVSANDLVAEGKATSGGHAVVAVAHCDKLETKDPLCSTFARGMRERNVPECIVFQNSWGESSNAKGYLCVSERALKRVLLAAVIKKSIAAKVLSDSK